MKKTIFRIWQLVIFIIWLKMVSDKVPVEIRLGLSSALFLSMFMKVE